MTRSELIQWAEAHASGPMASPVAVAVLEMVKNARENDKAEQIKRVCEALGKAMANGHSWGLTASRSYSNPTGNKPVLGDTETWHITINHELPVAS